MKRGSHIEGGLAPFLRRHWAPLDASALGAEASAMARPLGVRCERETPVSERSADAAPQPPLLPAAWFHENVERLWRVIARLGVPRHSIEDLMQEAFIVVSRRQGDIAPGQESAFLIGTAVRLCSNYRRRAHVQREVLDGEGFERDASPHPNAEQLLIDKRARELFERALAQLSEEQRAAFVLFELEGYSVPEIADLLELPLGTASARVWRARSRFLEIATALRRALEKEIP
jgi:RNA polymerase sigma-70 factor (ECF subfamily)